MLRPHIVILGAGFGGMYVARKLAIHAKRELIDVTIINRTNYFLFTPLLHEVATGALNPRTVAEPLREVFRKSGVRVAQGHVDAVDPAARTVKISSNGHQISIPYDYLVVATGAASNYYNIPGADTLTYPLKDLSDAARIRNRIIDVFEQAVLVDDPAERLRLLSFAVVGGGATGVEVAAELAEFVSEIVKRYYSQTHCAPGGMGPCLPEEPSITLVHTGKELLEQFAPSLRSAAARRLMQNGVTLQLSSVVSAVTKEGLTLGGNMSVPAATVIWAAGVRPAVPHFEGASPVLNGGRLAVDNFFRLLGNDHMFALGDVAGYVDIHDFKQDSAKARPLPMLAQVAVSESKTVAYNILASIEKKQLRDFHYHSKGSMVSVGQWFAVGEIFSLDIAGRITWWLWRTVYLFKFSSWQKRIKIAFEWTIQMFYPRDITKLT